MTYRLTHLCFVCSLSLSPFELVPAWLTGRQRYRQRELEREKKKEEKEKENPSGKLPIDQQGKRTTDKLTLPSRKSVCEREREKCGCCVVLCTVCSLYLSKERNLRERKPNDKKEKLISSFSS